MFTLSSLGHLQWSPAMRTPVKCGHLESAGHCAWSQIPRELNHTTPIIIAGNHKKKLCHAAVTWLCYLWHGFVKVHGIKKHQFCDPIKSSTISTVCITLDYENGHKNKQLVLVPRKCVVYKWDQESYKMHTVLINMKHTQHAHPYTQKSPMPCLLFTPL